MADLQLFASKLRAKRGVVGLCVAVGIIFVGLTIFLVPSQLGFILAGPLIIFPWALLCAALTRNPSNFSLWCIAVFALAGLAWPLIYI